MELPMHRRCVECELNSNCFANAYQLYIAMFAQQLVNEESANTKVYKLAAAENVFVKARR